LLIRGKNLIGARLVSSRSDVHPCDIRVNERGTYVFANVQLEPLSPPGDAGLRLETGADAVTVGLRLEPPLRPQSFHGAQGISQDDVIYLIMPDRFCDGDPSNNFPAGAPAGVTDRSKPRAHHGGDLQGVIDRLPYLQVLGVTAIWLTPWYDNFNGLFECGKPWCPYSYYHGYHAVDHYAVEDHLGTLNTLRELVVQAHARGIKVIQDQVSNHVGLHHPWVSDPPLSTWFHGTVDDHVQNPFRSEFLTSPHAAGVDRARVLDGWFSDDSPDLNQDEPEVARYLIQNALWWVGATGIDGIREDTAQYLPRRFLRDLTGALHHQHPRLTIVGEVMDLDPIHTSFFMGGRAGWDGIDTGLDSVFDFPTWFAAAQALSGKVPMTELPRVLRADVLYADPARLTTLTSNHDVRRFISWPGASLDRARLQVALTLMLRGIPQLYYGDEIGLPGEGDPDNRRDFPGGFPGDRRSAFAAAGRTADEERLWRCTRDWISLRRAHSCLRRGSLLDLDAGPDHYVFARRDGTETIVVALNRSDRPVTASFAAAALDAWPGMTLVPFLGDGEITPMDGDGIRLRVPACRAVAFGLK
jgi:glycosidase